MNSDWIKGLGVIMIVLVIAVPPWIAGDNDEGQRSRSVHAGPVQTVAVLVDSTFVPSDIELKAGRPVRLVFYRVSATACNEYVVMPNLGKKLRLAANAETQLQISSAEAREYEFTCGMGMMRGTIRFVL